MSYRIRSAVDADLEHLYEMAKLTGGGFTNLPPDRPVLKAKLDRSQAASSRSVATKQKFGSCSSSRLRPSMLAMLTSSPDLDDGCPPLVCPLRVHSHPASERRWRNGRRGGLKSRWAQARVGSSPTRRTT